MDDKKPVPPALAEFAVGERTVLLARIEDLEAHLDDTESRRANAAHNASAFEDRMGDLQVENGKMEREIAALREIISRSAEACGGYIDNACSLEFMALLPTEIKSVLAKTKQPDSDLLAEIAKALGDETITSFSQVATGIRDLKSRSTVAVPDALSSAFITSESGDGSYRVVIKSETLHETQQVHNWLARLNAAPAAPAADASDVLEQAMYALISIGYHENSGMVHELRQTLAANRAKGVV